MNFTPEQQAMLLELARIDQRISVLQHTRQTHPVHETLRTLSGRAEDLRRAAVRQMAAISDIEREVQRIEGDIEKVQARRTLQQGRIDRNEVPLRDVTPMQHEIARMDERLGELENEQIGAEERLESAREAETAMKHDAEAIGRDVEAAKAEYTKEMADVENELTDLTQQRATFTDTFPAGLLDEYTYAADRNGTLAIMEIRDGVPMGMAADLSPAEISEALLAPADELCWVAATSQIIVRTTS